MAVHEDRCSRTIPARERPAGVRCDISRGKCGVCAAFPGACQGANTLTTPGYLHYAFSSVELGAFHKASIRIARQQQPTCPGATEVDALPSPVPGRLAGGHLLAAISTSIVGI